MYQIVSRQANGMETVKLRTETTLNLELVVSEMTYTRAILANLLGEQAPTFSIEEVVGPSRPGPTGTFIGIPIR